MQVQMRDTPDSPWRDIDWLRADSIASTNGQFYDFEKFRIAPQAHNEGIAA